MLAGGSSHWAPFSSPLQWGEIWLGLINENALFYNGARFGDLSPKRPYALKNDQSELDFDGFRGG